MADRVSYAYATTCSQYKAKEKGLPWFAPDSPEFTVIVQLPLAFRGERGAQQHLFNSVGVSAFRLSLPVVSYSK
jgi:hypothetical protein